MDKVHISFNIDTPDVRQWENERVETRREMENKWRLTLIDDVNV